ASVVLTFQSSFAAELEPRTPDTLWTRSTDQIPGVFEFKGCAMGGNPRVLMTGTFGGDLIAFDAMTGDTLRHVKSQLGSIFNISFARNANLFSTSSPLKVMIWKWPEMEVIREFTLEKDAVGAGTHVQATLTSDGKRILLAAYDHKGTRAGLYDVETGDHIFKFPASPTMEPKISADDRIALVYTNNPQAYDLTTGKWLATLPSGGNGATSMDISEDGRYVAVSCAADWEEDGAVTFYDMVERREIYRRWLDWRKGQAGYHVAFSEGAKGYFMSRVIDNQAYIDYHPTLNGPATIRYEYPYYSCRFSSDWKYTFNGGGGYAFVSRLNVSTHSTTIDTAPVSFIISPNPSTGALTVSGLDVTDGPVTWTIADITGTQICDGITTISSGSC
ncbi:MAG TPA: hypothetical protein PLW14_13610, partial [Chlorobiota bacterium]|nr:hypothetical protein [Chlorobiota bacterium]